MQMTARNDPDTFVICNRCRWTGRQGDAISPPAGVVECHQCKARGNYSVVEIDYPKDYWRLREKLDKLTAVLRGPQ